MPAAWLGDVQGTVEASDADLPLVIRTARGFGQVIFFAGDLDEPPLKAWSDRPLFVARLLDLPAGAAKRWARARPCCTTDTTIWPVNCVARSIVSTASGSRRSGWSPGW